MRGMGGLEVVYENVVQKEKPEYRDKELATVKRVLWGPRVFFCIFWYIFPFLYYPMMAGLTRKR